MAGSALTGRSLASQGERRICEVASNYLLSFVVFRRLGRVGALGLFGNAI